MKMKTVSLVISLSFFFYLQLLHCRRISQTDCSTSAAFYLVAKDTIIDETPIFINFTDNLVKCIEFCISIAVCKAINTHLRNDKKIDCQLLRDDHIAKPASIKASQGWNLYDTESSDTNDAVGSHCSTRTSNPCQEGCACVDTCDGYRCDCGEPEIFSSCKDALMQNGGAELYYHIKNGNMTGSILVKCKRVNGLYQVLFDHNNEQRTYVHGYESCGSYKKSISYSPNKIDDIVAFINSTASCKQHTKAECDGTYFMRERCAYVVGSHGKILNYWGGGPTDGTGCACGLTGSCYNKGYKCNCNANVHMSLQDQGYLTDKNVLPVTLVSFGDTGHAGETMYYTIGKLECIEE